MNNELLHDYFEQEMESMELPADLASGVILAIESAQRVREARWMVVCVAIIAALAIGVCIRLDSIGILGAIVLGIFAYFFTVAEIRQKRAIYA